MLEDARGEAERLGHDSVGAEHILLALLRTPGARGCSPHPARTRSGPVRERGSQPAVVADGPGSSGDGLAIYLARQAPHRDAAKWLGRRARGSAPSSCCSARAASSLEAPWRESWPSRRISADDSRRARRPGGTPGARTPPSRGAAACARAPVATPAAAGKSSGRRLASLGGDCVLLLAVPLSIVLRLCPARSGVLGLRHRLSRRAPARRLHGRRHRAPRHRTGPTIGGLLNATFGNAAELIIAIVALRAGLVELVKASITGSILGNLLLILGLALVAGGPKRHELRFNRTSAGMSAGMLALAVVALVFPALFHALHPEAAASAVRARCRRRSPSSCSLTYGFSLLFTLQTHRRLFGGEPHPRMARCGVGGQGGARARGWPRSAWRSSPRSWCTPPRRRPTASGSRQVFLG